MLWESAGCRSEVREAEGVKIYFDPVSTAAREESARELAAKVVADPAKKDCINTVILTLRASFENNAPLSDRTDNGQVFCGCRE